MTTRIGALITGGDFQGLGVLRTLAKKSIPTVLVDNDYCIGKFSKFCKTFYKSPPPSEKEAYVDFLISLARKERLDGWIIFPNSDELVCILSKYKEILEEYYRIPTPHWNVIRHIYIKKNTYQLAEEHQISVPKTYYTKNLQSLLELDLQFPLVIKPSIRDNFYTKVKVKAYRVNNFKELIKIYNTVVSVIDPSEILIQEFRGRIVKLDREIIDPLQVVVVGAGVLILGSVGRHQ